ncbi:MAG: cytochrome b/b6 domain-containing protein [Rhodoferax sp.]|nr:cytochrome b/b6 domain-containing protein [Rhodoferax sp.]
MTNSVLTPHHLDLPTPTPTQRKPVVDLGTRMAHASMALAFVISYATSESEYWRLVHVYSGYCLAAVLAFRLVWGWVGPVSARWGLLLRRLALWRVWLNKFKQGEWQRRTFWVGVSSWVLSVAVLCIYVFCTVAIASGWATYNELLGDGWLNDAVQELHQGLGNAAMAGVCIHVGLVVMLRIWRGPQALRPMWRGYANTSGRG